MLLFGSRGISPEYLWDTMDIQALKLELVQQLVSTDDATVLTKVKRLLELLHAKESVSKDEREEELIAAATIFGRSAYGDDEPDISGLVLKEPEPIPVLRAEVKRLVDEMRATQVLSSVLAFLRGDQDELLWRSVLSARTERAEADFEVGRVYTQDQVEAHFKAKHAVNFIRELPIGKEGTEGWTAPSRC